MGRMNSLDQAAAAHGVHRRKTLCAALGRSHVAAQLSARRWQSPVPGVVVAHNAELSDAQQVWVTLLSGPPGTSLHGLTAALHDGFRGFAPDHLGVVIPAGSRAGRLRSSLPADWNVVVRWSSQMTELDINPQAIPPRTRLARSLVDGASERVPARRARAIILAAVQQRLVKPEHLTAALERRGRCRHLAVIVESICDAEGGIASLPERDFDEIRRRRGLPEPRRQAVLRRRDGRYFLDADWPIWGVRAEIHGIPHSFVANWDDDLLRQNDIAITGGLLVFSSYAVRRQQNRVGEQLEAMFRRKGWAPGRLRP
jgi:hypothetical protein